ncbi:MAG: hypothetical protein GX988_05145 [Clostridiales bacterium]|nr:hypothetical protein [Clostridiales bacterium]
MIILKNISYKVALGGVISAISVFTMMLTGIIPLGVYVFPAIAGLTLVLIVIEVNTKWALLCYLAVSILSLLVTPDIEAKLMFIFFLGYYPIIKAYLEQTRYRIIEWILKFVLFNISVIIAYMLIIHVFGLNEIMDEFGEFGKYGAWIMLGAGNIVFVLYDITISRLVMTYLHWLRPRVLRRFR